MRSRLLVRYALLIVTALLVTFAQEKPGTWKPDTDWGHWRLGQKADLEFLKTNNDDRHIRERSAQLRRCDSRRIQSGDEQAKATNGALHDKGFIVLRYLTSSIHGRSASEQRRPAERSDPDAAILA